MEYIKTILYTMNIYIYTHNGVGLGWEINGHYRGIDSLGRVIIICLDFLGWNADFQGMVSLSLWLYSSWSLYLKDSPLALDVGLTRHGHQP